MHVSLEQLQNVSDRLFSHLRAQGIKSVEIAQDYYWDIPKPERYDPYHQPTNLNLGQLTDDWDELLKIVGCQKEPVGYALVWLASVLRAVGEHVVG